MTTPTLRQLVARIYAPAAAIAPLTDPARIDRTYRRKRVAILLALTLGYAFAYTCRLGLSVVKKPLIDAGIMNAEQLGAVGAALLWGYGAGKFFNGMLSDHAHIRRFLVTGLVVSAVINLVMSGTASTGAWTVLWGLNGWFQGFLAPGSVVALTAWFSNRERGFVYGVFATGSSIGEGLVFVISAGVVTAIGWRAGFWVPGIVCILVAVAMLMTLEDRPPSIGLPSIGDWKNDHAAVDVSQEERSTLRVQRAALRRPAIWLIGVSSALVYVTRYAFNDWGILYLQEAKHYSLVQAGSLLGVSTIGGIAGAVGFGLVSDRFFGARRPPVNLLFGLAELAALAAFFWLPPGHPWLTGAAAAAYGFAMNGLHTSLGGLFAVDLAPKRSSGLVMGVIGGFSYLGAGIQDRVTGALIHRGTTLVHGVRHYDFGPAILFWVGASVLSLVIATSLWRVRPVD